MAPVAGVELVGVLISGFLNRLDEELSPAVGPAADWARNRPDVGVAEDVAVLSLSPPPKLKPPKDGADAGCEAAGCDAGVDPPRVKPGGLLAGVVLERPAPPNSPPAGLGVSCELGVAAGAAPPNNPAEAGGVALLFASFEPPAPPKSPVVGVEAPAGLAPPNRFDVVPEAGAAAGFDKALPNRPLEVPLDWVFCAPPKEKPLEGAGACPNMPDPGGGPAGVVEGREKVLLGAGVAAGVEEPVVWCQ